MEEILREFVDWARDEGHDSFYIYEETEEAIKRFIRQKDLLDED